MRSIWKGHIRFSLVTIPIQIFSAIESKKNIQFDQLHKEDRGRVGYKRVCKVCDTEVANADIVKGFEYAPDQYVVFEKEELEKIKLKSTRAIDIETFVEIGEVHPSRYEAVYFVGPDGDVAKKTFNLFCEVLKRTKKAGIGRIILRDKEDVVLMSAEHGGLFMYKLRYPYELRKMSDVPGLEESEIDETQLKLAETLVSSLSKPFDEIDFKDRYKKAFMEMVEEKVAGKEIISIEEEDEKPIVDIMDALKASIEAAKKLKKGA